MWLVTFVKFRYKDGSQRRAIPLPCCPRAGMVSLNDIRTAISSENIQLEEVVFIEEEFLYKKIRKKDVYVGYSATAVIPQIAVKQYGDLTAH